MKWFLSIFFSLSFVLLAIFGTQCVYGYLFPIKFQDEVENACEIYDVEMAVIFSMINIESHFDSKALSNKGAVGLMQIMPATAKSVADKNDIATFDLTVPQDNILIGTCYIRELLDRFGNLETALVAYNAGPTNVSNWLKNEEYSKDGKILTKIPFKESKQYIKKFRKNFAYYKAKIKE